MKWTIEIVRETGPDFDTGEMYTIVDAYLFYGGKEVAKFGNEKIATVVCRILNALKYNPFRKKEVRQ